MLPLLRKLDPRARAQRAEAERDRYRQALVDIACHGDWREVAKGDIARAALNAR